MQIVIEIQQHLYIQKHMNLQKGQCLMHPSLSLGKSKAAEN